MVKTKHAFVDDNPFLAYGETPETTVNDSGGSGASSLVVDIVSDFNFWGDVTNPTTLVHEVSGNDIISAIKNNRDVVVHVGVSGEEGEGYRCYYLRDYNHDKINDTFQMIFDAFEMGSLACTLSTVEMWQEESVLTTKGYNANGTFVTISG